MDGEWSRAMLDAEVALAAACAEVGLIPAAHAAAIAAAAAHLDPARDLHDLGGSGSGIGNPVGVLVRGLTEAVGGAAASSVHLGATSQDIVDTATMLVARRALDALLPELDAAAAAVAALAERHADTPQVGRTLLQHAPPVTFGLTAAGWLGGLDAAAALLRRVRHERLAVQLGGPTGTLAGYGADGQRVLAAMARRLGLAEPVLPWHTERSRVAELASALAQTCGAVASGARDVVLLAQTEVGEVSEDGPPGAGGSSAMPHKRNPIAAVSALAAAAQAPGLVATVLAAMAQEHQRAAGAWHAEWRPVRELLDRTAEAVSWWRTCLERLRVHPERMLDNLRRTGGLVLVDRVSAALAPVLGRTEAHDAVAACCRRLTTPTPPSPDQPEPPTAAVPPAAGQPGPPARVPPTAGRPQWPVTSLVDALLADPVLGPHLDRGRVEELLDPATDVRRAAELVARALRSR